MELETNTNMCRCCATEGTFKDVKTAYQWMGEEEVYSDMLRECFDVCLMETGSGDDGGICEVCITQLRNASNFKRQVLYTESQFKLRLQNKESKGYVVKLEPEHAEDSNESDNDATGDYDPDFDIKAEDEPKPKRPKRGTTTITLKKAKKTAGETSGKRLGIIRIERPTTSPAVTVRFISKKPFSIQTDRDKNRANLVMILTNSNANPIGGTTPSCNFCIKKFAEFPQLKKHFIEEHRDEKTLRKTVSGFFNEVVNVDITDLTCTVCGTAVDSLDTLLRHLQEQHNVKVNTNVNSYILPFKFESNTMECGVCNVEFNNFKLLREHMNVHFRNYICEVCSAGFVTERRLIYHMKRHESGEFKCDNCEKTFGSETYLRDHIKRTHMGKGKKNLCHVCGERFMDYWKKRRHMVQEHGAPPTVMKCQACERTFDNQRSLSRHTRKDHLMERKHGCDHCDMMFFSKSCLAKHMVKHTGQRTYKCDVCSKAYARKNTLTEHMRIHANDRRFACVYCGLAFVQKCSWRGHMRSKHGENV